MANLTPDQENVVTTNVARWIDLKKTIKTHQKKITELKAAQKLLEDQIIRTMKEHDIPNFQLPTGSLKLKTKESKKAVPAKWIREQINKVVDGDDLNATKEVIEKILVEMDNPPTTQKESLVHSG